MLAPTPTTTTMPALSSKGNEGMGRDAGASWPLGWGMFSSHLLLLFFALLNDFLPLDYMYGMETTTMNDDTPPPPPRVLSPAPPQQQHQARPVTHLNDNSDTFRLGLLPSIPSHNEESVVAAHHSTQHKQMVETTMTTTTPQPCFTLTNSTVVPVLVEHNKWFLFIFKWCLIRYSSSKPSSTVDKNYKYCGCATLVYWLLLHWELLTRSFGDELLMTT